MVRLTTPVHIPKLPRLGYRDHVVLIGSCFTESIGSRLVRAHFPATVNPHGTLFNPASIARTLSHALADMVPAEGEFTPEHGLFVHPDYHSQLAGPTAAESQAKIRSANQVLRARLKDAQLLILTLGTAWVYELNGRIVTNCHRMPASSFTRRCLNVGEVVDLLRSVTALTREENPDLAILLTVSPVRHTRDGMRENSISKSTLLLATHQVTSTSPNTYYFPAYELLIDELRDYRYYGPDLVHPSELGEEMIWERFATHVLTAQAARQADEILAFSRALSHQPRAQGEMRADFLRSLLERMDELEQMPGVKPFDRERASIQQHLHTD